MRLFVALPMPEDVQSEVSWLGNDLREGSCVPEEQVHLTLRFLGERPEHELGDLIGALSEIDLAPLELTVKGVGLFPGRGQPRVAWAGVERSEELDALQRSVDRAIERAGVPRERRKFHPHLTVARFNGTRAKTLVPWLQEHSLFGIEPFTVDEFRLYSSVLRPEGAHHRVEESFALGD
ncbi:MAG: RNA 2',3'-cyclic phosphodiesterase [Acidobacteriota bacterium]